MQTPQSQSSVQSQSQSPDSFITLLTKYTFRVLHIGSIIAISYKTISDYLLGSISSQHSSFFAVMGIVLTLSGIFFLIQTSIGLINTFLLKPKLMGKYKKLWMGWHHLKFLATLILFSPIYKFLPSGIVHERFYWLVIVILVSPAARFYREYYTKKNQDFERQNKQRCQGKSE